MKTDTDSLPCESLPESLSKTSVILKTLQKKSPDQLKQIWKCNDSILAQNLQRLEEMDLQSQVTPAVLSYDGLAYQHMAPSVFEDSQLEYIQNHLRILSGFYGVLKPMDGVKPYRLEMQAKLAVDGSRDLYEYWGSSFYQSVRDESRIIINLASREYSKAVEHYLQPADTFITCTFAECVGGKMVQKGTFAKMARGEMVRFMAENQIENPEDMKAFGRLQYHFREDLSSNTEYVFERISE